MINPKIEKFTISRNDEFMEGWPDLVKLSNGRLLVFYNECECHPNRDNTYITMRKSDNADQGYSAWVNMDDGAVLMANYIADDAPKAYIRGYRIKF